MYCYDVGFSGCAWWRLQPHALRWYVTELVEKIRDGDRREHRGHSPTLSCKVWGEGHPGPGKSPSPCDKTLSRWERGQELSGRRSEERRVGQERDFRVRS